MTTVRAFQFIASSVKSFFRFTDADPVGSPIDEGSSVDPQDQEGTSVDPCINFRLPIADFQPGVCRKEFLSERQVDPAPKPVIGGGIAAYTNETLTLTDIVDILLHPDVSKVIHVPPVKPRAGETYLIECQTFADWSCDQYQWVHIGKSALKHNGTSVLKNHFHIRMPGFKQGKGRTRPNSSNKFKRCSYFLDEAPQRILVTYDGDESVYIPQSHGNSKSDTTEYVRSSKSVLNELKKTDGKPMNTYRKLSTKNDIAGVHHGVLNPRNLKQVQNHQSMSRKEKKLGKDDIYNLIQLAYHLDGFVSEITVFPDLLTVVALPDMISVFIELLQNNTSSPVCLVYDTTFNLGDFYVSPLVFRHVLFEGNPWIPLAFLIHDRKLQKCHNRLFEFLSERIPILRNKKIPIVTDREPALTKSIELYFPNMQVLHCWNHLKRDFKEELRKLGADHSEISLYLAHWRQMAQCQNVDEFHQQYERLTSKWSEKVKVYFDRCMKNDLLKYSGRWIVESFPTLYDSYSGITNNASESINAVLKRMSGWQELPVDCMALSIFHLQNFYFMEIQRGRANIGNYKLKTKYKQATIDKDEILIPDRLLDPEEIISYVRSDMAKVVSESNKARKTGNGNHRFHLHSDEDEVKDENLTTPTSIQQESNLQCDEILTSELPGSTEKDAPLPSELASPASPTRHINRPSGDHLIYCLERNMFTPFPRLETKAKLNKKKVCCIEICCDCKCRLPNIMQEMVGCDARNGCLVWRHRDCAGMIDSLDDWFCTPHRF